MRIERAGLPVLVMDPAPGFDPDMPHDRGRAVGQHSHCPPGQERKGNCTPEGGFIPPGHQQDGRSIER